MDSHIDKKIIEKILKSHDYLNTHWKAWNKIFILSWHRITSNMLHGEKLNAIPLY